MIDENRSLVTYILFSILTCGIYSYYYIYKMAQDINTICDGDGKNTQGLVVFVLLNIVTCGIYSWIYYYNMGNRLAENAPRYGLTFTDNGTTILIWFVIGTFVCGIGFFIAMYILIKNLNELSRAYNMHNFQSR